MLKLFLLLKGAFIVTVIKKVFYLIWTKQRYDLLHAESAARGFEIQEIVRPNRKAKKNSPFKIDPNHVNNAGDWIYYRFLKVVDIKTKMKSSFWVKVVLTKDGKSTCEWRDMIESVKG